MCVFVLVHVYPWNDEIQLDLSETRVDLLLPQGGDDSAWRSSSSLPSVLAAACVCVCVFLIQRGCGCVSLQGFGLRLHVSSENERHMSLIWSFDLLYLLLNICVCSVVSFFGGWNIEGFLAQVECLSVRECVCESGSA